MNQSTSRTESEILFERYLQDGGYQFEFEPALSESRKRPDFRVRFDDHQFFFEVKERHGTSQPQVGATCFDSYAGIRDEINEARRKFRMLKDSCCSLVLFNAGDLDTILIPIEVFSAMFGDAGISWGIDTSSFEVIPGSTKSVFGQRGKMVDYKQRTFQNTTISSIIILERARLRDQIFEAKLEHELQRKQQALGRSFVGYEEVIAVGEVFMSDPPAVKNATRLVVCENPGARIPLPEGLFRGLFDERYKYDGSRIAKMYKGARVDEIESGSETPLYCLLDSCPDEMTVSMNGFRRQNP
ncbi:MAG: hypothetical protein AABZ47_10245 [Planctomycetota bacterium]